MTVRAGSPVHGGAGCSGLAFLDNASPRNLNASAHCGAVAQMGERCNRTAEVRGSIPLGSTSGLTRPVAKTPVSRHPSQDARIKTLAPSALSKTPAVKTVRFVQGGYRKRFFP